MIISTDTVWAAGTSYNLQGEVQVAPGATLTIEPGAKISGGTIRVYGKLNAAGSADQKITFNNTNFLFGSDYQTPGEITISNSRIVGGSFLSPTGYGSYGNFHLNSNHIENVSGFYIWYPTADSDLKQNIFFGSSGLSIGTSGGRKVIIEDNVFFAGKPGVDGNSSITVWANYGSQDDVSVIHNSFLGSQAALEVKEGYSSAKLFAFENFFETSDIGVIANRILDRSDSLNRSSYIDISFLANPSPTTPVFVPVLPIKGTDSSDIIRGTIQDDDIFGYAGDDLIFGHDGNDDIDGGRGNDVLLGGRGADKLVGGVGNDSASYASAARGLTVMLDSPSKNSGDAKGDKLISIENLVGSSYADKLTGDGQRNRLEGAKGNDVLNGKYGDDTLVGGLGHDVLNGGTGADKFMFSTIKESTVVSSGRDLIEDFKHAQKDRIDLKAIDASTKINGDQSFSFIGAESFHRVAGELRFETKSGGTLIYADVNGDGKADFAIALDGLIALQKGDFIL